MNEDGSGVGAEGGTETIDIAVVEICSTSNVIDVGVKR